MNEKRPCRVERRTGAAGAPLRAGLARIGPEQALGLYRSLRVSSSLLFAVALLAAPCARASGPSRDPRIAEGVALHDQGQYEKAIAKYREVLETDPRNVEAIYELAFSYLAKKDTAAALEWATKGTASETPHRPALYLLIGNIHDQAGRGREAVAAYEAGIRDNPRVALLHFNLGVAYLGQRDWKNASTALEKGVTLKPDHASGHFYLAQAYEKTALKVPALLANVRFLILEPRSDRSAQALKAIDRLFALGYSKDEASGNVTLTLSKADSKEEGDFDAAEAGMLLVQAAAGLDESGKKRAEPVSREKDLSDTLTLVAETAGDTPKGFAASFYGPYFKEMAKAGLVEAASHVALQSTDTPEARKWLLANKGAVSDLAKWSAAFRWPVRETSR